MLEHVFHNTNTSEKLDVSFLQAVFDVTSFGSQLPVEPMDDEPRRFFGPSARLRVANEFQRIFNSDVQRMKNKYMDPKTP